jgi:hypothetical protein
METLAWPYTLASARTEMGLAASRAVARGRRRFFIMLGFAVTVGKGLIMNGYGQALGTAAKGCGAGPGQNSTAIISMLR